MLHLSALTLTHRLMAQVWDVQNMDGTGKHLDSGEIKAWWEFLELSGALCLLSDTCSFVTNVQGFYK